jgi:hypothetical protein
MLVYGDRERVAESRLEIVELRHRWAALSRARPGIEYHAALVALFIRAGEFAQGVADAEFERVGEDRSSTAAEHSLDLLRFLAGEIARSRFGRSPVARQAMPEIDFSGAPDALHCRRQEGYAFYSVYPEAYLSAGSALAGLRPHVIGIRSIGAGLGAAVAHVVSAPSLLTVRPVGAPFRRELALSAQTKTLLERRKRDVFAVVDEGPGLSGSSFASVADALEELGVASSQIHFFPSHGGEPGSAADAKARARWSTARKHVACFETTALPQLADWCADLTGEAVAPLEDIGAGEWRRRRPAPANEAPVNPMRERRKYLLRSEQGIFLLRFAGLGDYGAETHTRAALLSDAGFTPRVLGIRHGFLIERWLDDATPLRLDQARSRIVTRLADYLAFRSQKLPAGENTGASLVELAHMLAHNLEESLGAKLDRLAWIARASELEPRSRRVQTDNRLHCWEWVRTPDGSILKTDAYDHCADHDLVGCQDITWDLAGASIEFALSSAETSDLCAQLRARQVQVDNNLLEFMTPCYLSFQLGLCVNPSAAPHLSSIDIERWRSAASRYSCRLQQWSQNSL